MTRRFKRFRSAKARPVSFNRSARRSNMRLGQATELKFFDTSTSFTVDATAEVPAGGQWCLIPVGGQSQQRIGRHAMVKSVQWRGSVVGPTSAAEPDGHMITFYIMLDTQANGAAAAVTDAFTSTNLGLALRNLNNDKRFRILGRIVIAPSVVGLVGSATANNMVWPIEFYKKVNIPLTWNSTAGAITEITENNIFLIAGATAVDDEYTVTGTARLRYVG